MKIKLRNIDFCDNCEQLKELNTLGQHKKCLVYGDVLLQQEDVFLNSKGLGYLKRPRKCKDDNEAEVVK